MTEFEDKQLALLEAIRQEAEYTRRWIANLARHLGVAEKGKGQGGGAAEGGGRVASDSEIDGKNGDRKISFDPKAWSGEGSFKGWRMSEAPPEFLELYADALDEMAERKDGDEAKWTRLDAARARGWARRKRTQDDGAQDFR